MGKKLKLERIDLFGDLRKIVFDAERKEFQGVGRISPTDTARLISKIAEHYSTSKSKRGKRIAEISAELSKLVKEDCAFYADTYSYIASGFTFVLNPEQKVITMKNEY